MKIDLKVPAIVIAFSSKLLRSEHCINAIDGIKNS